MRNKPASTTTRRRQTGDRGRFAATLIALLTLLILAAPATARAPITAGDVGETPTTGGVRPGPVGLVPETTEEVGVRPVAIKIATAEVDADVEVTEIVDGVMQNPTGPWVVSWYKETGLLGENDNIVMAGHVDYWDVGEAVFFHLGKLKEGDKIEVRGEDGEMYQYTVEWVKDYELAQLDGQGITEIVGPTESEQLTLITCGGPFDYNTGQYLERKVVRASRAA